MEKDHEESERNNSNGKLILAAETMRSAGESAAAAGKTPAKEEERVSLFWRLFGGTILSITSLVLITLYNNLSTGISDLRNDLNKQRDAMNELVKKEDFNTRSTNIYDRIRGLDALKVEIEGLRERVTADVAAVGALKKETAAAVDGMRKDLAASLEAVKKDVAAASDQQKKDEALMVVLKERIAAAEELKKDVAGIEVLKEKLTGVTSDFKAMRDDIGKLQQEADKNRSGDLERKSLQELQYKQFEESMKELQKNLQDCREKLARLEGAQPAGGVRPVTPPTSKP
jgi:chromosome segregation ATPase